MKSFNRREFLATTGAALASSTLAATTPLGNAIAETRRPPNFLFVISDQMRADALAVSGNPFTVTPNLDRLARSGIRFSNAYCAQALCTPSRGAMLSGVYPHTSGLDHNVYAVPSAITDPEFRLQPIWPQLLRNAGYYSSYIGKWHLGTQNPGIFDEWFGYNSLMPHWSGQRDKSNYMPNIQTERAIHFLEKRKRAQPFLLMLSYYPPHNPYDPPTKDEQIYVDKGVPHPDYYGAVTAVDRDLGLVLVKLKELGLEEDTFVIFVADHGDTFGTRLGSKHKTVCYDDSAKVPCLLRWPNGFAQGLVYSGGITTLDLMPTILEAAGLPAPARGQGKSLLSEMRRNDLGWKGPVFVENITQLKIDGKFAVERAVRTEEWKLILRDHPRDELYNLADDPLETRDLISQPTLKGQVRELARLIRDWGQQTGDPVGVKFASRYT